MTWASDTVSHKYPCPIHRHQLPPWFYKERERMKWKGRFLEQQQLKTCDKSDQTQTRNHVRAYYVVAMMAKKFLLYHYCNCSVSSSRGFPGDERPCTICLRQLVACCDHFVYLAENQLHPFLMEFHSWNRIWSEMDTFHIVPQGCGQIYWRSNTIYMYAWFLLILAAL